MQYYMEEGVCAPPTKRKKERVDATMIQVSKEEMKKLRERFPGIRATRTVHKYYIEENPRVLAFLGREHKDGGRKHA